jgi:hypothetical protein
MIQFLFMRIVSEAAYSNISASGVSRYLVLAR